MFQSLPENWLLYPYVKIVHGVGYTSLDIIVWIRPYLNVKKAKRRWAKHNQYSRTKPQYFSRWMVYPANAKLDKNTYVKENQNIYCISQTF